MGKHSPDMPIAAAFVGAQVARIELAETDLDAASLARTIRRTRRAVADVLLLEQQPDVHAWPFEPEQAETCQQAGCRKHAEWFVRRRRGAAPRPAYRRLCIRDAARSIRRRTHISTTLEGTTPGE